MNLHRWYWKLCWHFHSREKLVYVEGPEYMRQFFLISDKISVAKGTQSSEAVLYMKLASWHASFQKKYVAQISQTETELN